MQPASGDGGDAKSGSSSALKRYGPIVGIVAVAAIVIGVIVATSGDDDDKSVSESSQPTEAPTTTSASSEASTPASESTGSSTPTESSAPAGGEITYPLSFSQAEEQGITVDWGDRCDTTTGRVAVPDFFATECYAPFTGDNGGATDEGVTGDEITIVQYLGQETDPIIKYITDAIANEDTNQQEFETVQGMVDYFQSYYETYGRKVKLVLVEGTGGAADETAARADATHIAQDIKPFMVWGGPALTNAFGDELAANGIGCIGCTPVQPSDWYVERDPLMWAITPSAPQTNTHVLEMIQKQLIGKNATHAGDEFVNTLRKFGLLWIQSSANSQRLADDFAAKMAANGAPLAESVAYELNPATIQQSASQAIAKFKAAGVTSVIFSGDPVAPRDFTKEATAQGYFPEWIVGNSALVDTNAFARTYDQEQWKHAFGYTYLAARTTPETAGYYYLYKWFKGVEAPAKDTIGVLAPNAALFFAVLENAGPNLTHETWKEGLFAIQQTQTALTQPSLGWGDKGIWDEPDYEGIDDAAAIWWDPTTEGPDEIRKVAPGMWQFVDGGARHLPGDWPTEDKFFNPDGAVAIYTTPPPGEAHPDYPSPAG
jgi:hypothetical protein